LGSSKINFSSKGALAQKKRENEHGAFGLFSSKEQSASGGGGEATFNYTKKVRERGSPN